MDTGQIITPDTLTKRPRPTAAVPRPAGTATRRPWWRMLLIAALLGPLGTALTYAVGVTDTDVSRQLAEAPAGLWITLWIGIPLALGVRFADWWWPVCCVLAPFLLVLAVAGLMAALGRNSLPPVDALGVDLVFFQNPGSLFWAALTTASALAGTVPSSSCSGLDRWFRARRRRLAGSTSSSHSFATAVRAAP